MPELFTALVHKNNEPNKVDLFGSFYYIYQISQKIGIFIMRFFTYCCTWFSINGFPVNEFHQTANSLYIYLET